MGEARRKGTKEQRVVALLDQSGVVQMTAERYNAFVAWTRSPIAEAVGIELEFFSDRTESLIGVLIKDRYDRDFGFVMLGRDDKSRFRCIDVNCSMTRTNARHALFALFRKLIASGEKEFPQGDEKADKAGVDLFNTKLPVDQQHRAFHMLCSHAHWACPK